MKIVKALSEIDDEKIAITIGNFDGVHIGHQFVINKIKKLLVEGEKLVVLSFDPHPVQVLSPKKGYLINLRTEKLTLLENLGVDFLYEIEFSRDLSTLTGSAFLNKYIQFEGKEIKFYLGHDFSFGANKKDGIYIINNFCHENNLSYQMLDKYTGAKSMVSSSNVREKVRNGSIEEANRLLGREFYLSGTIVKGEGRGRQIGFPTANLQYSKERVIPGEGVYQTHTVYQGGVYKSVTNIGSKPTFESAAGLTVETYILDFDKDIYGETFKLEFIKKIRDEKKFKSVNELIKAIGVDVSLRREND